MKNTHGDSMKRTRFMLTYTCLCRPLNAPTSAVACTTARSVLRWVYYMQRAERVEEVELKMVTNDSDTETEVIIRGDAEEVRSYHFFRVSSKLLCSAI